MNDEEIFFTVIAIFFLIVSILLFEKDMRKKLKKPIDIIQKKNADNDLDKKLERLQKLGQLLKDGVITKEEFEEQKNKIKL